MDYMELDKDIHWLQMIYQSKLSQESELKQTQLDFILNK
jgi:hypothetical protein